MSFLSFWSLLIRMNHLICYHNIWSRHIYLAMPTEYYVAGIRKTVLCFFFPFSLWRVKSPSNNLKRSHIAKVCYFLYNLFWLCLSFPLHIFFFYLPDDPFVVGFVILNEKNGPLVSIILLLKTGLDENKALSYTSSILKVKSMSSSEILPS